MSDKDEELRNLTRDPELVEDEEDDDLLVEKNYEVPDVEYDPAQFELPDDFEYEGDVDA